MKISKRRLQSIIRSVINEEAMMQMPPRQKRRDMSPMSRIPQMDAMDSMEDELDYHDDMSYEDDYDDMPEDDMEMEGYDDMPQEDDHHHVHVDCQKLLASCDKEECCSQLSEKYHMIELMEGLICAAKHRDADCAEILAMCLD